MALNLSPCFPSLILYSSQFRSADRSPSYFSKTGKSRENHIFNFLHIRDGLCPQGTFYTNHIFFFHSWNKRGGIPYISTVNFNVCRPVKSKLCGFVILHIHICFYCRRHQDLCPFPCSHIGIFDICPMLGYYTGFQTGYRNIIPAKNFLSMREYNILNPVDERDIILFLCCVRFVASDMNIWSGCQ